MDHEENLLFVLEVGSRMIRYVFFQQTDVNRTVRSIAFHLLRGYVVSAGTQQLGYTACDLDRSIESMGGAREWTTCSLLLQRAKWLLLSTAIVLSSCPSYYLYEVIARTYRTRAFSISFFLRMMILKPTVFFFVGHIVQQ